MLRSPCLFDNHLRPQFEFLLPGINVFLLGLGFAEILTEVSAHIGIVFDMSKLVNQKLYRRLNQIKYDLQLLDLNQNASIAS